MRLQSYVGVQLVLALDLIRSAAMREGHPDVGPILVLSYKNHALDEVLLDVLKAKKHQRGALVRCGKAEDQELSAYTEQRTAEERTAQVWRPHLALSHGLGAVHSNLISHQDTRQVSSEG